MVAVLGICLLEINDVLAQGDEKMIGENETGLMNSTGIINAPLAFAQGNDTMSMGNDTFMMMNATLPMSIIGKTILPLINNKEQH